MSAKPVQTAETDDVIVVDEPTATSAVVVESSDDDDDIAEVVLDTPAAASASADAPANAVTEAVTTVDLDPPADGSKAESTPIPVVDVDVVADAETISMDVSEETASKTTAPTISVIDSAPAVQQPKTSVDTSLGLLAGYGSGSDGSDEDDGDDDGDDAAAIVVAPLAGRAAAAVSRETHAEATKKLDQFLEGGDYRVISDSSEEEDSDDDNDADVASAAGKTVRRVVRIDDDDDSDVEIVSKSREFVKAKGELGIDELPPIEDLKITVPEDECILLGKIFSIVEQLVIVDSVRGAAPLDLETVLFLDKGTNALGRVFDVLGQISEPLYCVRFNSNEEILAKGITVGTPVFVAPRTEHTIFVILGNLQREKGCDASWEHDVEPPSRCMEYSDDEEERNARKVRRGKKTAEPDADGEPDGADGAEGQKRQRNTSITSSEASAVGAPAENWRQQSAQLPGGRFQRGGGRGGQRGARGGRGGFRGQPHNQQQPQQHQQQQHQQSNQSYGGGYQQQQQQQHANNWSNPRDNYSWHTNLPYNGGPAMQQRPQQQQQHQQPPPQHAYYAQPPPPTPHMYHQYGAPNGAPAGYPYQPHPVAPMPYGGFAAPPPVPQMYGGPSAHYQPPPPGYQQSPPPPMPHQQQQQQPPPPHGRN